MPNLLTIANEPRSYPSPKLCIYCGSVSGALSDEHILAHGLAGDSLIFKNASCPKCAKATESFETVCLRHLWWPFRTKIGAPNSGKQTPETFSLKRMKVTSYDKGRDEITYDQLGMEDLTPEEYPLFFQTFDFPEPGIIANRVSSENVEYRIWCKIDDSEFKKSKAREGEGFRLGPGKPEAVCKILAKIAHGYAVAEIGFGNFEPLLAEYICGRQLDRLQFIGGLGFKPKLTTALHKLSLKQQTMNGVNYVVVDIRLFACIETPSYRVIVGKLDLTPHNRVQIKPRNFRVEICGNLPFPYAKALGGIAQGGWS